jgi:predicted Zn-dependent peptidase
MPVTRLFRLLVFPFLIFLVIPEIRGDAFPDWTDRIQEVRLSNGMKFLLYVRGEAPIFSAYIRFRAGGIDEEPGKTGIAHFLEHMAFKGTSTVGTRDFEKEKPILEEIEKVGEELAAEYGKGKKADPQRIKELRERLRSLRQEEEKYLVPEEFSKKVLENGGNDQNATTSKDMTSYFVSMPSDKLRSWAELESERIFRPVFREFYEEKDVVLEERRMRVDNDPDGRLYEAFLAAAFEKSPYRWPTIGKEEDLLRLTVRDLRGFWQKYYHPSNGVGLLVGRFDPDEAKKVLEETFGRIDSVGEPPAETEFPQEPPQRTERRLVLRFAARPRIWIGYHKPTLPERDDYLFDLLDQILGDGRSSRLYRSLVLEKKVASDLSTSSGLPGSRLPNLFLIEASPIDRRSPEEVLKEIDAEIERVKREGVTERELEKAKNRLTVDLLWRMKTNSGMASQLSYFEIIAGSWKYLANYLEEIERFKPEDIQRLANEYLKPSNRTVAILKP